MAWKPPQDWNDVFASVESLEKKKIDKNRQLACWKRLVSREHRKICECGDYTRHFVGPVGERGFRSTVFEKRHHPLDYVPTETGRSTPYPHSPETHRDSLVTGEAKPPMPPRRWLTDAATTGPMEVDEDEDIDALLEAIGGVGPIEDDEVILLEDRSSDPPTARKRLFSRDVPKE